MSVLDTSTVPSGLRHRSPIGTAVLGGVSQRLLPESAVPVLAVQAVR